MNEKRYHAIEVIQQPSSPPMYMIAVPASELLEWCDVPRTMEKYMAGYQRLLNDARTNEISDYLRKDPNNILPGAVIVSTDEEFITIEKNGDYSVLVVKEDARNNVTKLQELFGAFTTRLSSDELASAEIQFSADDMEGNDMYKACMDSVKKGEGSDKEAMYKSMTEKYPDMDTKQVKNFMNNVYKAVSESYLKKADDYANMSKEDKETEKQTTKNIVTATSIKFQHKQQRTEVQQAIIESTHSPTTQWCQ